MQLIEATGGLPVADGTAAEPSKRAKWPKENTVSHSASSSDVATDSKVQAAA